MTQENARQFFKELGKLRVPNNGGMQARDAWRSIFADVEKLASKNLPESFANRPNDSISVDVGTVLKDHSTALGELERQLKLLDTRPQALLPKISQFSEAYREQVIKGARETLIEGYVSHAKDLFGRVQDLAKV